jgi:hypothetical protein
LFVNVSISIATPPGPRAPKKTSSTPTLLEAAALTALSTTSFGILFARALLSRLESAAFESASEPPARTAALIAIDSFPNVLARCWSLAPFDRAILLHLEWPAHIGPLTCSDR